MRVVESKKTSGRKKNSGRGSNRMGIIAITCVVVIFGLVLFYNTQQSKKELQELEQQESVLQVELEEQQTRRDELEEQRIYVQTKKYVEEMAKKFGLVYPGEIIFKPKED